MDHGLMREAASLLQRLPLVDSEKFVAHSTTVSPFPLALEHQTMFERKFLPIFR
jgi:hypothetical protein